MEGSWVFIFCFVFIILIIVSVMGVAWRLARWIALTLLGLMASVRTIRIPTGALSANGAALIHHLLLARMAAVLGSGSLSTSCWVIPATTE